MGWVPGGGWHHPPCFFPPPAQGVAEAELEKDIGRTLKVLIRSTRQGVGVGLRGDLGWEQRGFTACPWPAQPDVLSKPG